jgi:hypothetical protein
MVTHPNPAPNRRWSFLHHRKNSRNEVDCAHSDLLDLGEDSAVPSGALSSVPAGEPAGERSGVTIGASSDVTAGVPSGVTSGAAVGEMSGVTSGAPPGVTAGAPSRAGAAVGVSSGVPTGARSGGPAGVTSAASVGVVEPRSSSAFPAIVVIYDGRDAAFTAASDGTVLVPAKEYALALLKYIQKEEALHGRYVTSNALEMEFYPAFLGACGWAPRPWRPIAIALGKLTEKRHKEYRCAQRGKWKRKTVVQYFIPAPPT